MFEFLQLALLVLGVNAFLLITVFVLAVKCGWLPGVDFSLRSLLRRNRDDQRLEPPAYSSAASDTFLQLAGGGNLGDEVVCARPVYTGSLQKRETPVFRVLATARILRMMTQSVGEPSGKASLLPMRDWGRIELTSEGAA